jgi:hypothetical protein
MLKVISPKTKKIYYLHSRRAGRCRDHFIYFFGADPTGAIDLPAGFEIIYNKFTGFPLVRRKKNG